MAQTTPQGTPHGDAIGVPPVTRCMCDDTLHVAVTHHSQSVAPSITHAVTSPVIAPRLAEVPLGRSFYAWERMTNSAISLASRMPRIWRSVMLDASGCGWGPSRPPNPASFRAARNPTLLASRRAPPSLSHGPCVAVHVMHSRTHQRK